MWVLYCGGVCCLWLLVLLFIVFCFFEIDMCYRSHVACNEMRGQKVGLVVILV